MRVNDGSKTDFDRAKIKLTGHFDRRLTGRYFEPWSEIIWVVTNAMGGPCAQSKMAAKH